MTVPYELSRCTLGCAPGDDHLFEGTDRLHGNPGRFGVVRCRSCGLMRTSPRVPEAFIGSYYPPEYGPHDRTATGAAVRSMRQRSGLRAVLHRRWVQLFPTIPPVAPGGALEFGCGSGAFLEVLRAEGWRVKGIELSGEAAEVARSFGHDVFCGRLEDAPSPPRPYDLIVGLMVLEHLYDPIAALRLLAQWAGPSTYLVVSVPNAASVEFSVFGNAWYALHLPNHITHFTPESLERVLEAGGWGLERLIHQPSLNNALMSAHYVAEDRGAHLVSKVLKRAARSRLAQRSLVPFAMGAALVGQTGRMTAWARLK